MLAVLRHLTVANHGFLSTAEILPDVVQVSDMLDPLPRIKHTLVKAAGDMLSDRFPPTSLSSESWELYLMICEMSKSLFCSYTPRILSLVDRPPIETCEALKVNRQMMRRAQPNLEYLQEAKIAV